MLRSCRHDADEPVVVKCCQPLHANRANLNAHLHVHWWPAEIYSQFSQ